MITRTSLLLLAFMAATSLASTGKQTYIIHMDKTKMNALDQTISSSRRWFDAVLDYITELSAEEEENDEPEISPPELLYVYETAISGFSAKLSAKQFRSLSKIDGFLHATTDELLTLHTTHSPQFLGLQPGKGLWRPSVYSSEIIIGIVDSGIWPEHVSFSDSGMPPVPARWRGICEEGPKFSSSNCNKKLIGARAFFKGYEAMAGRINETVDYRSARDSIGHGTHTASTAAGNVIPGASFYGKAKGTATGMIYSARIAAYKVCYPGGCVSSDVLAAIDQAVSDGVDVVSLSLGGLPRPYFRDNMAIASFGAIRHGVFVSASAGNSGPSSFTVGNTAPWIMTVAASSIDRSFPTSGKLGNGESFEGQSLYSGKPTKNLQLVYGRLAGGQRAEYCINGSLSPDLVKQKIVICDRGIIGRTEKGERVKEAGGAGMILLNRENEGEEVFADPHVLPATAVGFSAGNAIKKYINSTRKPTASIIFKPTSYGDRAPIVSEFSSRGPNYFGPDVIKPDITAPGLNILAAWPPTVSPTSAKTDNRSVLFNIISGTSMSCPHVSGISGLLKSAHRDWSPAAIKSALMTTAYNTDNRRAPVAASGSGQAQRADPFALGSGHVDPERASNPGLIYDIAPTDYLKYLCSLNYNSTQISLFSNYTCPRKGRSKPGDLNYPSFAVNFDSKTRNKTLSYKRIVTNVGAPMASYAVQIDQPGATSVNVTPKYLKFNYIGQKLSYKVSFVADGENIAPGTTSFGSLVWVFGSYSARSPIAVTWQ